MPSHNKRERPEAQSDEEKKRQAKERRADLIAGKIETQLCAGYNKLHRTGVLLHQVKANLEMIGGLVCRQKDEIKQNIKDLHAVQRGTNIRLTVVAEAAQLKYLKAMYDQISELSKVEEAIAKAHAEASEDNAKRTGHGRHSRPFGQARGEMRERQAVASKDPQKLQ